MIKMEIHEKSCRGCGMCVDICPTKVFSFDEVSTTARINVLENCIECLSCQYLCPSKAIEQSEYRGVKNFYWDVSYLRKVGSIL